MAGDRPVEDLIQMAKNSGGELLGRLLDHYRAYLRILAERQMFGAGLQRVDASDVVQQTMLEAHRAFGGFRGTTEPELAAWLMQILDHNVRENVRNHTQAAKRAVGRE